MQSRIANFWTLPVIVFGISSMHKMGSGSVDDLV
jgi:hypothetical protein